MKWWEVSVRVDGEAAEAVAEFLSRELEPTSGAGSVVIEVGGYNERGELVDPTVTVKAYLPADEASQERLRRIEEGIWHLGQIYPIPEPTVKSLTEADWTEAWKSQFHPLRVGQHMVIKPSWAEWTPQPEDIIVEIDPGMAFGTGLHPTTRLCLALLERYLRPGAIMLDQGTGTGILSIAAVKLGAAHVDAVDVDLAAVRATEENAALNGVADRITVIHGSSPPEGPYSLIACNILAPIIIQLLDQGLSERLIPGGVLIASGILDTQAEAVIAALTSSGLALIDRAAEGDWVALVAQRADGDDAQVLSAA